MHIKTIPLGGDSPVVIQTMWKDRLSYSDLDEAEKRITELAKMGCGILRFAVPDIAAAEVLGSLAERVSMPLVADIHFDHNIALRCMDFPIAKLRINPGNIGSKGEIGREKIKTLLDKAADKEIPIRIGVNGGSLPQDIKKQVEDGAIQTPEALVEAAERELEIFNEFGFSRIIVSIKASKIADTISANRIFAARNNIPLHLGLTEAGPLVAGIARSSAALSILLAEGIGDTIRVSLSGSMENEVIAAREILGAAAEIAELNGNETAAKRLRQGRVSIISCPRCGRHGFDTHGFLNRHLPLLYSLDRDLSIAVMGCEVNGPHEARHADLGITGSGNKVIIFRQGKIVKVTNADEADDVFLKELERT